MLPDIIPKPEHSPAEIVLHPLLEDDCKAWNTGGTFTHGHQPRRPRRTGEPKGYGQDRC